MSTFALTLTPWARELLARGWEDSFAFAHTDAISVFSTRVYTCKSKTTSERRNASDHLQAFTSFNRERARQGRKGREYRTF